MVKIYFDNYDMKNCLDKLSSDKNEANLKKYFH